MYRQSPLHDGYSSPLAAFYPRHERSVSPPVVPRLSRSPSPPPAPLFAYPPVRPSSSPTRHGGGGGLAYYASDLTPVITAHAPPSTIPPSSPRAAGIPPAVSPSGAMAHRAAVLAAVRQHWANPQGLPYVVADVRRTLGLESDMHAIDAIEAVLGVPLPRDLLGYSSSAGSVKIHCPEGMHCPRLSDRAHLDEYKHPCPHFYETGRCPLRSSATHEEHYSHHSSSTIPSPESYARPPPGLPVKIPPPPGVAPITSPTARHTTHPASPSFGKPSPYSAGSPQSYGMRDGRLSPSPAPEFGSVQQMWETYWKAFEEKKHTVLADLHSDGCVMKVHDETDNSVCSHTGPPKIGQYYKDLFSLMPTAGEVDSLPTIEEPQADGVPGQIFLVWKCPSAGIKRCTETLTIDTSFRIVRHTVVVFFSHPTVPKDTPPPRQAYVSRSESMRPQRIRPPPEPFSDDPRLRGNPLSPDLSHPVTTPLDEPVHNYCSRGYCPRATSPPCPRQRQQATPQQHTAPTKYSPPSKKATSQPPAKQPKKHRAVPKAAPKPSPRPAPKAAKQRPTGPTRRPPQRHTRDSPADEEVAATKIQSLYRGRRARDELKKIKEEEQAATKIQAAFKGKKAREDYERQRAAIKIQSRYRGGRAREQMKGKG